jgi:tetratricopeptide (TPR) repeat protein
LFIIFHVVDTQGQQEWKFDTNTLKAYNLAFNLQTDQALSLIANPKTVQEHYVASLTQALELLVTEDGEKFTDYEVQFQKRLERKLRSSSADEMFLQAEIHLQWAFVYLKFGHELDAALNLRQAYNIVQDCKTGYPDFIAIRKTSGLLDVIIGSMPEKYEWVLGLLGMKGSAELGLKELQSVESDDTHLAFEAALMHALVQGFILQNTAAGVNEMKNILRDHADNRIALFVGASLAIKNAQSAEALVLLNKLASLTNGLPIYYANYLMGEVYLHKGDYANAITAYHWFLKHYDGQNYLKDAHYKIGLCYLLNGNTNDADVTFKAARNIGKEVTEADRYAARSLADPEPPNIKLTRIRYYTDGGYYDEAEELIQTIIPSEIPTKRDRVEFYYRKARLAHKTNQISAAKLLNQQVIEMNSMEACYFAPNSFLQLGYIALDAKDYATAKVDFTRALSYKKHEYKNSIDSKAKSALAQLNKRK